MDDGGRIAYGKFNIEKNGVVGHLDLPEGR